MITNNKNSREQRKLISQETLVILADKSYLIPTTGQRIELQENIQNSIEQTIIYTPGDYSAVCRPVSKNLQTQFFFVEKPTLECVQDILIESPEIDVVALNFASAKNPGGGFLKGSQAQEESIARASAIYSCLTQHRVSRFYRDNHEDHTCLYTHNIIYSPKVSVFRDSNDELLENPFLCSFITSPAVNAGHALGRVGMQKVRTTMLDRIDKILGVAVAHGHEVIVLGAWGCGVFANSVEEVAKYFRDYLNSQDAKYKDSFSKIYFAIPDQIKLNQFQTYFQSQAPLKIITNDKPSNEPPKRVPRKNNNNDRKGKRVRKETRNSDDDF